MSDLLLSPVFPGGSDSSELSIWHSCNLYFNHVKSEGNEIWLNEFLFYCSIKTALSRRTSSWNSSNPIELLLMRQAHAAIQLPSTNCRYSTGEADSHLAKWKWKNNWTDEGTLLEILAEFITRTYSVSRLAFLLFMMCFESFCFSRSSEKLMYIYHHFIIPSCFVIPPSKFFLLSSLPKQFWSSLVGKQCVDFSSSLPPILIELKQAKMPLAYFFCSVSRNLYNLQNIKYSSLCSLLCRARKRNGSRTKGLRKFRCTE